MNKRFLIFAMLFVLIFSSLSVFATEGENRGTTGETTGGETTTLTVEGATFTLEKNATFTGNLPTIEGETDLTYRIVTQPEKGTLTYTDSSSRAFSYTPDTDYVGNDSFTFKVTKGEAESNVATITLTISEATTPAEPEEPEEPETLVVKDATFTLEKNSILTTNLPGIEGETELKYVIVSEPTNGTVTHADETSASFTYTPKLDYVGNDSFTFKVTKGELESNVATDTLTIEKPKEDVIPFTYIDMQNHWANYSASQLASRGLIVGEEIGSRFYFYPYREMTRSEFILFLLAITESNEDAEIEIPKVTFADSDTTPDWLIEAAKLAYAKGIIKGSAEGNSIYLNAYAPLTRTEAVVMINNVLKPANSTNDLTYSDIKSIPEWGLQAVKNLTAYKIIQGSGNEFDPNSIITRGQAAEMCYKLIKQLEKDALDAGTPVTDVK